MLRHLGQHGDGVLVYTHNLLREMLAPDTHHEFVPVYQGPSRLGSFSNGHEGKVRERALGKAPNFMWDQWLVPQAGKKGFRSDFQSQVFPSSGVQMPEGVRLPWP